MRRSGLAATSDCTPYVTAAFIAANVLVWLFLQNAGGGAGLVDSLCRLGVVPAYLTGGPEAGGISALLPAGGRGRGGRARRLEPRQRRADGRRLGCDQRGHGRLSAAVFAGRGRPLIPIFIFFFRILVLPAWVLLGLWFLYQTLWFLYQTMQGLLLGGTGGGVAIWAHVGGPVAGLTTVRLFALSPRS